MTSFRRPDADAFRADLCRLGFARSAGGAEYRRGDVTFTTARGWGVLETDPGGNGDDPSRGCLGSPGLWKRLELPAGPRRVFELPPAFLGACDPRWGDPRASESFRGVLSWALATAGGEIPEGWSPPARDTAESWIPPEELTMQAGPDLRQGSLIRERDRLAIELPVLPAVPPDLPPVRAAWLHQVLLDAQRRWRMVRVGRAGSSVRAEIDLTGAPLDALERLSRTGLDALRWVIEWLVPVAGFVADGSVECRALEVRIPRARLVAESPQPGGTS